MITPPLRPWFELEDGEGEEEGGQQVLFLLGEEDTENETKKNELNAPDGVPTPRGPDHRR